MVRASSTRGSLALTNDQRFVGGTADSDDAIHPEIPLVDYDRTAITSGVETIGAVTNAGDVAGHDGESFAFPGRAD